MDRRQFLGAAALTCLAAPLGAQAQAPARVFRIGLLAGVSPTTPEARPVWDPFFQGLRALGYVEGQNVVIEGRYYADAPERLPNLAAELVRLPVDVIVTGTSPAPEEAKRATSTIPIVMTTHNDPVGSGLVASLARPGGNVTGLTQVAPELLGKQLQLLKEVVPGLSRVAVLSNPAIPFQRFELRELDLAARSLKIQLEILEVRAPSELAAAHSRAKKVAGALFSLGGSMVFVHRARMVALAAESRLPTLYRSREYPEAGGLMSYGVNLGDNYRRAATFVARILEGTKPLDLPVEQPTKFELVINLKTAKALGLTIPPAVLARADQVIQ